jgi:hypothetical protein
MQVEIYFDKPRPYSTVAVNDRTEFHENPTDGLVTDTKKPTEVDRLGLHIRILLRK